MILKDHFLVDSFISSSEYQLIDSVPRVEAALILKTLDLQPANERRNTNEGLTKTNEDFMFMGLIIKLFFLLWGKNE